MRLLRMLRILFLISPALLCAQGLSDFYVIRGYSSPMLRTGQYVLSLTPHFFRNPASNSSAATLNQGSLYANETLQNPSGYSYVELTATGVYGLSNQLTLSVNFIISPNQNMLDRQYLYSFAAPGYSHTINNYYADAHDHFNAALTLSYRPQPSIELSFFTRYVSVHDPSSFHGSEYLNNNGSIVNTASRGTLDGNSSVYDFSISVVLLGQ